MPTLLLMGALLAAAPAAPPPPPRTATARPAPASKAPAPAPSAGKAEKIRELLQLLHTDQAGPVMLQSLKAHLPADQYARISPLISSSDLTERFVAIYDRHFSESEIEGLIAFYESPLGQRLVAENPAIAQESQEAGQRYAVEKLQQLNASKAAPHPQPAPADVPAKTAP
jgi:hypothetical protein